MSKVAHWLEKLTFAIGATLIVTLLSMVLLQTLLRNLFRFSIVQLEELCMLLLSWLTFISASFALRRCAHVAVDYFYNKIPRRIRYWINVLTIAFLIAVMVFLAYHGWGLAMRQMKIPLVITHIPRGYMFMAAPVCSVLMILFLLDSLVECVRSKAIVGLVIDTNDQIEAEMETGRQMIKDILEYPEDQVSGEDSEKGEP